MRGRAMVEAENSMAPAGPPALEATAECPHCHHAWTVAARWVAGPCPKCGKMVYRWMEPELD